MSRNKNFDQSTSTFLSGEASPAEIDRGITVGANAYLIKPNDSERLIETTETVVKFIEENKITIKNPNYKKSSFFKSRLYYEMKLELI